MTNTHAIADRVADAPSGNWVYRVLPRRLWPYAQLARWDRPIGWQLLMWPCWWSAALAGSVASRQGLFDWHQFAWHLALFMAGSIVMRGAGCTYNDLVDHRIDADVARTRSRPLPSGRVSRNQAVAFMVLQALTGFLILLQFNLFAIALGIASLAVVALYPFAKRFTDWPQFFLGLAFSWGALMGWAAVFGSVSAAAVALYAGSVLWTIGYDTIYAHQDKEDDALVGVRSTARLFEGHTKTWLLRLYSGAILCFAAALVIAQVNWVAYVGLAIASLHLLRQVNMVEIDDSDQCLRLFKSNSTVGFILFTGLLASVMLSTAG